MAASGGSRENPRAARCFYKPHFEDQSGLASILGDSAELAPSKPTKLGFDGFLGSLSAVSAKIRGFGFQSMPDLGGFLQSNNSERFCFGPATTSLKSSTRTPRPSKSRFPHVEGARL
jgi:hypothetical protein